MSKKSGLFSLSSDEEATIQLPPPPKGFSPLDDIQAQSLGPPPGDVPTGFQPIETSDFFGAQAVANGGVMASQLPPRPIPVEDMFPPPPPGGTKPRLLSEIPQRPDTRPVLSPEQRDMLFNDAILAVASMPGFAGIRERGRESKGKFREMRGRELGGSALDTLFGAELQKRGLPPEPFPEARTFSEYLGREVFTGRGVAERLPIVGGFLTAARLADILTSSSRIEAGKGDQSDMATVAQFQKDLAQSAIGRTTGGTIGMIVTESIPFMLDFAIAGVGTKALSKGLNETTEIAIRRKARRLIQKIASGRLPTLARIAGRTAGMAVETAVRQPFFAGTIASNTLRQLIPNFQLANEADGFRFIIFDKPMDRASVGRALGNAFVDQYIEVGTELTGTRVFGLFLAPVRRGAGRVASSAAKRIGINAPDLVIKARDLIKNPLIQKAVRATGFSGTFEEVGEEDLAVLLKQGANALGIADFNDQFPTAKQHLEMGAAFAVTPAAQGVTSAGLNALQSRSRRIAEQQGLGPSPGSVLPAPQAAQQAETLPEPTQGAAEVSEPPARQVAPESTPESQAETGLSSSRMRRITDTPVDIIAGRFLDNRQKLAGKDFRSVAAMVRRFAENAMTKMSTKEGPSVELGSDIEQQAVDRVLSGVFGKTEAELIGDATTAIRPGTFVEEIGLPERDRVPMRVLDVSGDSVEVEIPEELRSFFEKDRARFFIKNLQPVSSTESGAGSPNEGEIAPSAEPKSEDVAPVESRMSPSERFMLDQKRKKAEKQLASLEKRLSSAKAKLAEIDREVSNRKRKIPAGLQEMDTEMVRLIKKQSSAVKDAAKIEARIESIETRMENARLAAEAQVIPFDDLSPEHLPFLRMSDFPLGVRELIQQEARSELRDTKSERTRKALESIISGANDSPSNMAVVNQKRRLIGKIRGEISRASPQLRGILLRETAFRRKRGDTRDVQDPTKQESALFSIFSDAGRVRRVREAIKSLDENKPNLDAEFVMRELRGNIEDPFIDKEDLIVPAKRALNLLLKDAAEGGDLTREQAAAEAVKDETGALSPAKQETGQQEQQNAPSVEVEGQNINQPEKPQQPEPKVQSSEQSRALQPPLEGVPESVTRSIDERVKDAETRATEEFKRQIRRSGIDGSTLFSGPFPIPSIRLIVAASKLAAIKIVAGGFSLKRAIASALRQLGIKLARISPETRDEIKKRTEQIVEAADGDLSKIDAEARAIERDLEEANIRDTSQPIPRAEFKSLLRDTIRFLRKRITFNEPDLVNLTNDPARPEDIESLATSLAASKVIRDNVEAERRLLKKKQKSILSRIQSKPKGKQTLIDSLAVLRDEQPKGSLEPLLPRIGNDAYMRLLDHISTHQVLREFDRLNISQALAALVEFGVIPQPRQIRLMGMIFGPKFEAAIFELIDSNQLLEDLFFGIVNGFKALNATFDDSFIGNQAILAPFIANPADVVGTVGQSLKAIINTEQGSREQQNTITQHPLFDKAKESGVFFGEIGGGINLATEEFESQFFRKLAKAQAESTPLKAAILIPKGVGQIVSRAEQGFTVAGNFFRFFTFYKWAQQLLDAGLDFEKDFKVFKRFGTFINSAYGRDNLKFFENAKWWNLIFFTTRFIASRLVFGFRAMEMTARGTILTLAGRPGGRVQFELGVRSLFGLTIGIMAIGSALAAAAGALGLAVTFGMNPLAPDFYKLRWRGFTMDLGGGFGNAFRLYARIITGKRVEFRSNKEHATAITEELKQFFRAKASPAFNLAIEMSEGRTFDGRKLTFGRALEGLLTPISIQNTIEIYQGMGAAGLPLIVPEFFGFSGSMRNPNVDEAIKDLRSDMINVTERAIREEGLDGADDVIQAEYARRKSVIRRIWYNELFASLADKDEQGVRRAMRSLLKLGVSRNDLRRSSRARDIPLPGAVFRPFRPTRPVPDGLPDKAIRFIKK